MAENEAETTEPLPFHVKMIMYAFAPFVMLFAIVIFSAIGAFALVTYVIGILSLRIRMRARGRLMSRSEARKRLSETGGTLIIESPTLGWRTTFAWWTPDDLRAISPHPVATEEDYEIAAKTMRCTPWDKWCLDNYTSPDTGRAFLLRSRNGISLEEKVQAEFPKARTVRTWTALVDFQDREGDEPDPAIEATDESP